jgi:hypothetical protein
MSEVVPNASQEFWRPPVTPQHSVAGVLPGACSRCGAEFMVAARFCHACGSTRDPQSAAVSTRGWIEFLRLLETQSVKDWLGLSPACLIAFLSGVGCLLAALLVGLMYSAQNLADFQAVQLWRMQWLVAAVAAFAAGILLKRSGPAKNTGSEK